MPELVLRDAQSGLGGTRGPAGRRGQIAGLRPDSHVARSRAQPARPAIGPRCPAGRGDAWLVTRPDRRPSWPGPRSGRVAQSGAVRRPGLTGDCAARARRQSPAARGPSQTWAARGPIQTWAVRAPIQAWAARGPSQTLAAHPGLATHPNHRNGWVGRASCVGPSDSQRAQLRMRG